MFPKSKAKKVHYDPKDGKPLCCTNHGHQVTLTKDEERVTCKICLFHLGLYEPQDYVPSKDQQQRAERRLFAAERTRIQRMIAQNTGQQLSFL